MIRPADAVGVSAADVTDAPSQATNVNDAHNAVPSGHFFAGQTDAGVVLLCEAWPHAGRQGAAEEAL